MFYHRYLNNWKSLTKICLIAHYFLARSAADAQFNWIYKYLLPICEAYAKALKDMRSGML
jgi:hypothetical protein